jgi:hypothetical protein
LCIKKNALSYCRPTGRLDPNPADLAFARLELAALEYWARRGEIILLYEDETILWRFALLRAGWWRRAQRYRLPTRPLSPNQIKHQEALKRQAWQQYRSAPCYRPQRLASDLAKSPTKSCRISMRKNFANTSTK